MPTKKEKAAKVKQAKATRTELSAEGLEGGLFRLRHAEQHTYNNWMESGSAGDFKAWQQALDLLRKAEDNLLTVLEKRRELLPAPEVKEHLGRMIESTKAALLDMPARVAPSLDGLPWTEIQKKLETEIREALHGISKPIE